MAINPIDFAAMLCSRLCHDLLSPVGALNNGLELLADETDPLMRERCMELLHESARVSAAKLKFFRLAFGAAGGFGEEIDVREARAAIEALAAENRRLELGWLVEATSLPKAAVKVLLNLSLIGIEALPRGGRLDIGAEEEGQRLEIVVRAQGPRLALDPEIQAMLVEGAADEAVGSRTAAAYLIHSLAVAAGGSVQVSRPDPDTLLFGAVLMRAERAFG